jgi:hypothetical protein
VAGAKLLDQTFDAGSGREFQKNIRLATHTALGELFIPDEFGKCKGVFTELSREDPDQPPINRKNAYAPVIGKNSSPEEPLG